MAIAEVVSQRNSQSSVGGANLVGAYPAVPTVGNLLVAAFARGNNANPTSVPAGWALAKAGNNNQDLVYYKVAGAAEPQTPTWVWAAGTTSHIHFYEFSGNTATPLDVTSTANAAGTTLATTGALAAFAGSNEMVFAMFRGNNSFTWSAFSNGLVEKIASASGGVAGSMSTAYVIPGAAAINYQATRSTSGNVMGIAIAFKAVSGPAGDTGFLSFFD